MKFPRILALVLALLASPLAAQAPVEPHARPALWRLSDADTTVYLFGTIHALPPGVTWLEGPVAQAFAASGELVTEIVENGPEQMQASVIDRAVLPPKQSLRAMLNAKDRAAFERALAANRLPLTAFDRFEPWYAAIALATLPLLRDGYAMENGVEAQLDARARAAGVPRSALETADYQLALFDGLPLAVQKRYLRQVVEAMPDLRADLDAMVSEWKRGNPEKLAELVNEQEDDPALMEALLVNRNRIWADWIKARMDRPGTVFIAVGAGHLAGRQSVQDFLAAKGFTITRVQ
jgi:uncharacterized protein YbaP (TraB family)